MDSALVQAVPAVAAAAEPKGIGLQLRLAVVLTVVLLVVLLVVVTRPQLLLLSC
jgi:hypothetical protein